VNARRTDANHALLVKTLRLLGWRVVDLHIVPNFVDAVANRGAVVRLLEFKAKPTAPLTAAQRTLIEQGWPIRILSSLDDCVRLQ